MDDASTYYTNMVASGEWMLEVNKHTQIIVDHSNLRVEDII